VKKEKKRTFAACPGLKREFVEEGPAKTGEESEVRKQKGKQRRSDKRPSFEPPKKRKPKIGG